MKYGIPAALLIAWGVIILAWLASLYGPKR
jgi:hypothetical protein